MRTTIATDFKTVAGALLLSLLVGCGSFVYDDEPGDSDPLAPSGAGDWAGEKEPGDGEETSPAPRYSWGTPTPISELNSPARDVHASMTSDGLRLCFSSDRAGGFGSFDIYCATRTSPRAHFGPPVNQVALNSATREFFSELTPMGTELYFSAKRPGDPDDIFRATWDGTQYSNATPVASLNSSEADRAASRRTEHIYFHSDRHGDIDVYVATAKNGRWQNIVPVDAINSDGYKDSEPQINGKKDFLVFCSDRPNGSGRDEALWGSALVNGQWQAPELLDVSGSPNQDACGPFVGKDGSLLFHSDRNGGAGQEDIYIAQPR